MTDTLNREEGTRLERIELGTNALRVLAKEMGLKEIDEEEERIALLSTEQMKQLEYCSTWSSETETRTFKEDVLVFTGMRENGEQIVVVVRPATTNEFAAEIFSPAFRGGYGSNHDFNKSELRRTLEVALEGPVRE
ncbi:MAG: hypothetical protein WC730_02080 [Patescibacteria group bacterium]|jgi:hypothetical protein